MRAFSKYPHTRILLAATIVYLCSGCSDTRLSHRDALPHLRVESLLTLPLHDGTDGFDRLDRALRNHFDFGGGMNAPPRLETQKPATLLGGHVVRRYLRLDGRHLLVELDSAPAFRSSEPSRSRAQIRRELIAVGALASIRPQDEECTWAFPPMGSGAIA